MHLKAFVLVMIGSCGLLLKGQQNSLSFTVKEAEEYAANNSYSVVEANFQVDKARQTIRETAALGLPQISSSFGYSYNAQIPEQPIPAQFFDPTADPDEFATVAFGVEHQNQATLNVNQLVFDASYFVALRASRVVKQTRALEKETAELNARKNAAQSYYAVLVAERSRELAEEDYLNAQENYKETKALFEQGFVEKQDADQLELLVNNLRSNFQNSQRQVKIARQSFKFSLGIPLDSTVVLTETLDDVILGKSVAQALYEDSLDYEDHIRYRSLLSQERGAHLQLANERAAYYPKLNAFVNHTQSNFSNEFEQAFSFNTFWIPGTTIGATLSWDLFTGFRRDARVQSAKIDLDRIELAKSQTRGQLILDYQRARSDFRFAVENYRNQKSNLDLSRRIRDQTYRKYQEGLVTSLDLTQAENQLVETQINYFRAVLNTLDAKEELENALGR